MQATLTTRISQLTTRATQPKASRKQLKQAFEAFQLSLPISLVAANPALIKALELAKHLLEASSLTLVYTRNLLASLARYTLKLASQQASQPAEPAISLNSIAALRVTVKADFRSDALCIELLRQLERLALYPDNPSKTRSMAFILGTIKERLAYLVEFHAMLDRQQARRELLTKHGR